MLRVGDELGLKTIDGIKYAKVIARHCEGIETTYSIQASGIKSPIRLSLQALETLFSARLA